MARKKKEVLEENSAADQASAEEKIEAPQSAEEKIEAPAAEEVPGKYRKFQKGK
jgi:hypothetical protein